jgi:tetratricopeptide (TPR) repeat protein
MGVCCSGDGIGGEYNSVMWRLVANSLPRRSARWLAAAAAACVVITLAGCTPQAALLLSAVPEGTASILLSHFQGEEDSNRRRIAALEARGDWEGLAKFAEANLEKDRNNASWWFVAGYAHEKRGRLPRAIDCYSEMVRLAPDDVMGWTLLAGAYRDTRQPLRAVQALNNAHLIRKGTPGTYFLLGESYSDLDRDLPAAAAYREAVQLDSNFAKAWFGLGRTSARLGRTADYDAALKTLAGLDPAMAKQLAELRPPEKR